MNFKFLRGACVIIEGGGKRILCDPWLTDGEYYGAWAHYPPYDWKDDLSTLDYIYVSHIHPDHFSVATMKRLPKVPVLIHSFHSKFLRRNIENLGFEVRELPHNQEVDLGGIKINIIAADDCDPVVCQRFFGCSLPEVATTQIDSMAIFTDGIHVYANVNDCPYQLSKSMLPKIRTQYPQIDVMMVAYAGAGPYPQCFQMKDTQKLLVSDFKKNTFLHHAVAFAKDLKAKATFPFAGDYLLAGKLAPLNKYRGVASLPEVYDYFTKAGVPLSWSHLGAEVPDEVKREQYIDTVLSQRKLDYETDPDPKLTEVTNLIAEAAKRAEYKRAELGLLSKTVVYIELAGGILARLPLDGVDKFSFVEKITDEPYIKMSVDQRLLKKILLGPKHAHWNNAEIGSHIMFDRRPDSFERGIHQIMSFLHV